MSQVFQSARTGTSYWARNVVYADRSIIVLNKPAGLICQGSEASSENVSELILGREVATITSRNPKILTNSTTYFVVRTSLLMFGIHDARYLPCLIDVKNTFALESLPYPVHRLDKACSRSRYLMGTG